MVACTVGEVAGGVTLEVIIVGGWIVASEEVPVLVVVVVVAVWGADWDPV